MPGCASCPRDRRPSLTSRPPFSRDHVGLLVLNLGFARHDTGRERRRGLAEVVYAPGKTTEQIIAIVRGLLDRNAGPVLVTRVVAETAEAVKAEVDWPTGR